ncbi:MAG TPA: lytic transglycosylase domain-containing protein [Bryobacteraceae bacterium]|nr:lytic transglycosylase domain-containing protein [Bryobacteraceae bacterium]
MSKKLCIIIVMAIPAIAGEYAVLSSGLRLRIDHHENFSGIVRLYTSQDSFVEMAAEAVSTFELDDYVPPPVEPVKTAETPAPPAPKPDSKTLVHNAAVRYALPPAFVESVAKAESSMKPSAVSPKGAIGVMQLMPATARALSADPNDTEQNIDAGTRLLRELLLKYNGDVAKALAAYNAGEGTVDRYQGVPPYRETQTYVDKVIRNYLHAAPDQPK